MTVSDEMYYAVHPNKMHKKNTVFDKIFSFTSLNLGLVFIHQNCFLLFFSYWREPARGSITCTRWMAVHMGGDKSSCHFKKITNSSAPTGDNIML